MKFFSVRWNKVTSQEALGNFELLIDEELAAQEEATTQTNTTVNRLKSHSRWK